MQCDVRTKCLRLYMQCEKVFCSHLYRRKSAQKKNPSKAFADDLLSTVTRRSSATSRVKLLEISMVEAWVVESSNNRQSRKPQQMFHFLQNSKHSQQVTTHLTPPSWNQYVLSHQPNHVPPSALSCTQAAQLQIHESKTMAMLCLSKTHWACNQNGHADRDAPLSMQLCVSGL